MRAYSAYVCANGAPFLLDWGHNTDCTEKEHILRSMRGYFADVYANGAHVEVQQELICIRIQKRSTFWGPWGAILHTCTITEHIFYEAATPFYIRVRKRSTFWGPWGANLHTYTEKEHILRSLRGYFAYVYANGTHVEPGSKRGRFTILHTCTQTEHLFY